MADAKPSPVAGSNEMVERVAIAIFVSWYEGSFCEPVSFYTDCDAVLQADYRRIARAAIAALREPTTAMLLAMLKAWENDSLDDSGDMTPNWQAAIDAALHE